MVIALDGPAGAGKSTVARAVADALGFTYLDTGAMYRCIGLLALSGVGDGFDAASAVGHALSIARGAPGQISLVNGVWLNGEDVSAAIRSPAVSAAASQAAALVPVREALVKVQRRLIEAGGEWVAEGRDIGTVVWPQAELKVYLTASEQERARRRAAETGQDIAEVLADQRERDARDSGRAVSPLAPAEDAEILDSTGLDLDEVVTRIVTLASQRRRPAG